MPFALVGPSAEIIMLGSKVGDLLGMIIFLKADAGGYVCASGHCRAMDIVQVSGDEDGYETRPQLSIG